MKIERAKGGILSLFICLILILTLLSDGIGIAAAADPIVSVKPAVKDVNVSDDFSIFIEVDPNGNAVETALLHLTYDPTKVRITDVVINGTDFPINSSGDATVAGQITNIMGLNTATTGLTTVANLAEIRMHANATGTFTVGISGDLTRPPGDSLIPVTMNTGEVSIKIPSKLLDVTVLHPNGGESILLGTQVQVSARATDNTTVASVTFSYSNNSGSEWNSIGAGTRVSGTDKDGIWNRTWNTSGLGAGSNYLIRAVADNGTSTREDQSDSTFSLTSTPPSSNDNGNGGGGGSSSSSGGGSGSSGEDFNNIVISETDRQSIFKNTSVSFIFDLKGNIVSHINFTALNSAGTVAAKVEILNNTSTLVSTPPPDEVHKNLNIWVGNYGWATEKNIADTSVSFKVEKSWVTDNNIDDATIALYRYSDDNWHKLVTRKIAEDANSLQFEAETSGFSPFAVTGKKIMAKFGGEGIVAQPTATAEKTPVPTPTEKEGIPGFGLFAGLSVLLIAVQLLRKKK